MLVRFCAKSGTGQDCHPCFTRGFPCPPNVLSAIMMYQCSLRALVPRRSMTLSSDPARLQVSELHVALLSG